MKHLEKQINEIIDTCVNFYVANQPEPIGAENQPHNIAKQKIVYLTRLYGVNFLKWKQRLRADELVKIGEYNHIVPLTDDELFDRFTSLDDFNCCYEYIER